MAKNYEFAVLLDFYGDLLTEKRRDFVSLYYNEDLSLAEIAENEGLSRQGVRDTIKRAEEQLLEWEERLHLARMFRTLSEKSHRLSELAARLSAVGGEEQQCIAAELQSIAQELQELG